MNSVRAALLLTLGMSQACGAQSSQTSGSTAPTAAPAFEVHEWGLVRAESGDVLRVGAIAPPMAMPLVVLKPVLYFHTASALQLTSVTVHAADGGSIAEAWPLVPFDTSVRWNDVAIDPHVACTPSPLPTSTDAPCNALSAEDFCESSTLGTARTSDAACVTVGSAVEQFLFYRARATRFTPPLTFERTTTGVRITNDGALAIPGNLLHIDQTPSGTLVEVLAPPAPGASVQASSPSRSTTEGASSLRASMRELGLTDAEADAFVTAWSDALFGAPPTTTTLDLGLRAPASLESFVYFLPEASVDGIARIDIEPAPQAIRRAMAVWSVVAATGPTH